MLVGTLISHALRLLASVISARILGRLAFGELGMVMSTVQGWGVLAGLGLGVTATRYLALHRTDDPSKAGRILGLCLLGAGVAGSLLSGLMMVSASHLAVRYLGGAHLADALRLAAPLLALGAISGASLGALAGLEAFGWFAAASIIASGLSVPLTYVGASLLGLQGVLWARLATAAATCVFGMWALSRSCRQGGIRISLRALWPETVVVWRFALPNLLSALLVAPVLWIANLLVANLEGGYAELGLLSAAMQLRAVLQYLPSVAVRVALPLMASAIVASDEAGDQRFQQTLSMTQGTAVMAVLPLGVGAMFLSEPIMRLFGAEFGGGAMVLIGVACGALAGAIGSATGPVIQAQGKAWLGFVFNLSWAAVLLGFSAPLVPHWGAMAVAWGLAVAQTSLVLWALAYLAPSLPRGFAERAVAQVAFVVALSLTCALLPTNLRLRLALPAMVLTTALTLTVFLDEGLRSRIWVWLSCMIRQAKPAARGRQRG